MIRGRLITIACILITPEYDGIFYSGPKR